MTRASRRMGPDRTGPHDPTLAILVELEAELARELEATAFPAARAYRGRGRLRAPALVVRRALVLVALVSLVGASALAGRAVIDPARPAPSSGPAPLAGGGSGEPWQLEEYLHDGALCYALFVAGSATSACVERPVYELTVHAISALSSARRFVVGITGERVRQVLVRVGHRALVRPTHPLAPATRAHAHVGLPAGQRWFVAILPGEDRTQAAPALVTPRDGRGGALAAATLDCSLGAQSAICRRAAAHLAAGAG